MEGSSNTCETLESIPIVAMKKEEVKGGEKERERIGVERIVSCAS